MGKTKNGILTRTVIFLLTAVMFLCQPFSSWGQRGGAQQVLAAEGTAPETVYDFLECTYEVRETLSGKGLSVDSGITFQDNGTSQVGVVRYGDFYAEDALNHIPVAFTVSGNQYLSLAKGSGAGTAVKKTSNIAEDASQRFLLQKSVNWTDSYPAYKIYHPLTKKYLGLSESGTLQSLNISPEYDFLFEKAGDTELGKVRTLPGYQKLSAAEKTRLFDCLGGIGPWSFSYKQWVTWGNVTESFGKRKMEELKKLYQNIAVSADDQAKTLRSLIKSPVIKDGQTGYYPLPGLPGGDGITIKKTNEQYKSSQYFWEAPNNQLPANTFTLTISDSNTSQSIYVAVHDNNIAKANGENFLKAIKLIPYCLRRNITTVYIFNSNKNQFNCNGKDLHIRLNWTADASNIANTMTHEYGHSMDYSYGVNSSGKWQKAIDNDVVQVSPYGNSNRNEDMADFGRLYFQCYGNINRMYGLRQFFPNRCKEYVATLQKAGYYDIYEDVLKGMNGDLGDPNPVRPSSQADDNSKAAQKARNVINAIGTVSFTEDFRVKIEAARKTYDELTEVQKKLVNNLSVLIQAESDFAKLEEEAKNQETEKPGETDDTETSGNLQKPEGPGGTETSGNPQKPEETGEYEGGQEEESDEEDEGEEEVWIDGDDQEELENHNPALPTGNSEESKKAKFYKLAARVEKSTQTTNKLKWKKVKGAQGYLIFGNRCNSGGKKYKVKLLKTVGKNTTGYTHKKLKKGTYYKYIVQAYKKVGGKIKILSTSKTIHSATTGGKYGNPGSLKLNKTKITLKKGKKFTLKARESAKYKKPKKHRRISYESTNTKVARVSAGGVIQAKKKGKCDIYVYAQNGVYKRVRVTVK